MLFLSGSGFTFCSGNKVQHDYEMVHSNEILETSQANGKKYSGRDYILEYYYNTLKDIV